ncbi:recombination mediator RecR [Ferrovum myxofaciens]|jgi:recombination protein RecR|uniref:Recombination protein RecR n=2 Tax=root TaxID=1 RepID=A0A8F3E152_9PROT|nr:recombination mediator RecR [Ferrovum myxofaciens]NDU89097.1 recombination protein RecR [Ferrovum sp.]KXW58634.1 recombination protein RecR [Ferrovum myxofaciens]MBU6994166.1 recombination protein RecR [Ferrovum myxofaciens]QKE38105.1 MAG: recombination protein RecR [Ferrovum myxofaciens]QKE40682.1 MAG: recombination protein RecR [Ferrovum myxofaciens]
MSRAHPLSRLIDALRVLPGVGPRTAQRMAYQLLQRQRSGAEQLLAALVHTLDLVTQCSHCNNYSTTPICELCQDESRDPHLLCVVETPTDLLMMEQTLAYQGHYFVLMGHLSPLDGIGSQDIHLPRLVTRIQGSALEEVILATNLTAEGEATAHAIATLLRPLGLRLSRLARGVPVGGELEYIDSGTLAQALRERRQALN